MNFRIVGICIAVSVLLVSCRPDLNNPKPSTGNANFTRYVSVGGTIVSGYANQALYSEGQRSSPAAILSAQFNLAIAGSFVQPLIDGSNGLGINLQNIYTGKATLRSDNDCKGNPAFFISYLSPSLNDLNRINSGAQFQDFGIPYAKSFDFNSQYFGRNTPIGNPFYHRFASDTGAVGGQSATVLGDALFVDPTFFTCWIGTDDVFNYARCGGSGNISGTGQTDITPVDTFNSAVTTVINALANSNAGGLVASVPDIIHFPFFSSIPYNSLTLTMQEADSLNAISPPGISFQEGQNALIVGGSTLHQLKKGELVLYTARDTIKCFGVGTPSKPLPENLVLDSAELAAIRNAIKSFNFKLYSLSTTNNLAYADMEQFFSQIDKGISYNGVNFNNEYIKGGIFSLDGINLTGKGNALIANFWIDAINLRYKSTLPHADVNAYHGNAYP